MAQGSIIQFAVQDLGLQSYVDNMQKALGGMGAELGSFFGLMSGWTRLSNYVAEASNEFLQFNRHVTRAGALANASVKDLRILTDTAAELGRTTEYTATAVAEGMGNLALAGFRVDEMVGAMPGLLAMATSGMVNLERASGIAAEVLRSFRLESSKMNFVAGALTAAFTSTNTVLGDLDYTIKYVGSDAAELGVTLSQVAAAAGILGNVGVKGSMAGTGLREFMTRMAAGLGATKEGVEAGRKALQSLGLTWEQVSDEMGRMDMVKAVAALEDAFKRLEMTAEQKLKVLRPIFGVRAGTQITALVSQGAEVLRAKELEVAFGGAKQQLDGLMARAQNLPGGIHGIKTTFEEMAQNFITIGAEGEKNLARLAAQMRELGLVGGFLNSQVGLIREKVERLGGKTITKATFQSIDDLNSGTLKSIDALVRLKNRLSELSTTAEKMAVLEDVFGADDRMVKQAYEAFERGGESLRQFSNQILRATSALDIQKKQLDTVYGTTELMRSALQAVAIDIGAVLAPISRVYMMAVTAAVGMLTAGKTVSASIAEMQENLGGVEKQIQALVEAFSRFSAIGKVFAVLAILMSTIVPIGTAIVGVVVSIAGAIAIIGSSATGLAVVGLALKSLVVGVVAAGSLGGIFGRYSESLRGTSSLLAMVTNRFAMLWVMTRSAGLALSGMLGSFVAPITFLIEALAYTAFDLLPTILLLTNSIYAGFSNLGKVSVSPAVSVGDVAAASPKGGAGVAFVGNLEYAITGLIDGIGLILTLTTHAVNVIANLIVGSVAIIAGVIAEFVANIPAMLMSIVEGVARLVARIMYVLGTTLQSLLTSFISYNIQLVVVLVQGFFALLIGIIRAGLQVVVGAIRTLVVDLPLWIVNMTLQFSAMVISVLGKISVVVLRIAANILTYTLETTARIALAVIKITALIVGLPVTLPYLVWKAITTVITFLTQRLSTGTGAISDAVMGIVTALSDLAQETMRTLARNVLVQLKNFIYTIQDILTALFVGLPVMAFKGVGLVVSYLIGGITATVAAIRRWFLELPFVVERQIFAIIGIVSRIINFIISAVGGMATTLMSAGIKMTAMLMRALVIMVVDTPVLLLRIAVGAMRALVVGVGTLIYTAFWQVRSLYLVVMTNLYISITSYIQRLAALLMRTIPALITEIAVLTRKAIVGLKDIAVSIIVEFPQWLAASIANGVDFLYTTILNMPGMLVDAALSGINQIVDSILDIAMSLLENSGQIVASGIGNTIREIVAGGIKKLIEFPKIFLNMMQAQFERMRLGLGDAWKRLMSFSWQSVGTQIYKNLQNIGALLLDAFVGIGKSLGDFIKSLPKMLIAVIGGIRGMFSSAWSGIMATVAGADSSDISKVFANITGGIRGGFEQAKKAVSEAVRDIFNGLADAFKSLAVEMPGVVNFIIESINEAWRSLMSIEWQEIADYALSGLESVGDSLLDGLEWLLNELPRVLLAEISNIGGMFGGYLDGIFATNAGAKAVAWEPDSSIIISGLEKFWNGIVQWFNRFSARFVKIWDDFKGVDVWAAVMPILMKLYDKIIGWMDAAIAMVGLPTGESEVIDTIKSVLVGLFSTIRAGADLAKRILPIVQGHWGELWSSIYGYMTRQLGWAADAAGVAMTPLAGIVLVLQNVFGILGDAIRSFIEGLHVFAADIEKIGIEQAVENALTAVEGFLKGNYGKMTSAIVGLLGQIASVAFSAMWRLMNIIWEQFMGMLATRVPALFAVIWSISAIVNVLWLAFRGLYAALWVLSRPLVFVWKVVNALVDVLAVVFGALTELGKIAIWVVSSGLAALTRALAGLLTFLTTGFFRPITAIRSIFVDLWDWVGGWKDRIYKAMVAPFEQAYAFIRDNAPANFLFGARGGEAKGDGKPAPHLAVGGITVKPVSAVVGDAGPEAIVPLNAFYKRIQAIIEQSTGGSPSAIIQSQATIIQKLDLPSGKLFAALEKIVTVLGANYLAAKATTAAVAASSALKASGGLGGGSEALKAVYARLVGAGVSFGTNIEKALGNVQGSALSAGSSGSELARFAEEAKAQQSLARAMAETSNTLGFGTNIAGLYRSAMARFADIMSQGVGITLQSGRSIDQFMIQMDKTTKEVNLIVSSVRGLGVEGQVAQSKIINLSQAYANGTQWLVNAMSQGLSVTQRMGNELVRYRVLIDKADGNLKIVRTSFNSLAEASERIKTTTWSTATAYRDAGARLAEIKTYFKDFWSSLGGGNGILKRAGSGMRDLWNSVAAEGTLLGNASKNIRLFWTSISAEGTTIANVRKGFLELGSSVRTSGGPAAYMRQGLLDLYNIQNKSAAASNYMRVALEKGVGFTWKSGDAFKTLGFQMGKMTGNIEFGIQTFTQTSTRVSMLSSNMVNLTTKFNGFIQTIAGEGTILGRAGKNINSFWATVGSEGGRLATAKTSVQAFWASISAEGTTISNARKGFLELGSSVRASGGPAAYMRQGLLDLYNIQNKSAAASNYMRVALEKGVGFTWKSGDAFKTLGFQMGKMTGNIEFGIQTFTQTSTRVSILSSNMVNLSTTIGAFGQRIAGQGTMLGNVLTRVGNGFRQMWTWLENGGKVVGNLIDKFKKFWNTLSFDAGALGTISTKVRGLLSVAPSAGAASAVTGGGGIIAGVISHVVRLFNYLKGLSIFAQVGGWVGGLTQILQWVIAPFRGLWTAIGVFGRSIAVALPWLGKLGNALLVLLGPIGAAIAMILNIMMVIDIVTWMLKKFGTVATLIIGIIGSLIAAFFFPVAGVVAAVLAVILAIYAAVKAIQIFGPMLMSLAGMIIAPFIQLFQVIYGIVAAILGVVWKALSDILGVVVNVFGSIYTIISSILGGIYGVFSSVFGVIYEIVARIVGGIWKEIVGTFTDIAGIIAGIFGFDLGGAGGSFDGVMAGMSEFMGWIGSAWNWLFGSLNGLITAGTQMFLSFWNAYLSQIFTTILFVLNMIFAVVKPALVGIARIVRVFVVGLFSLFATPVAMIVAFVKGAFGILSALFLGIFNVVFAVVSSIGSMIDALLNGDIMGFLGAFFTGTMNVLGAMATGLLDFVVAIFQSLWGTIGAFFNGVLGSFGRMGTGLLQAIWDVVVLIADNIWAVLTKFNIVALITSMIEAVYTLVVDAFNSVYNYLAGTWIGKLLGLEAVSEEEVSDEDKGSIKKHKIPELAEGGMVNSPTLAVIGEDGPEAVVPLSGLMGAVAPLGGLMSSMFSGITGTLSSFAGNGVGLLSNVASGLNSVVANALPMVGVMQSVLSAGVSGASSLAAGVYDQGSNALTAGLERAAGFLRPANGESGAYATSAETAAGQNIGTRNVNGLNASPSIVNHNTNTNITIQVAGNNASSVDLANKIRAGVSGVVPNSRGLAGGISSPFVGGAPDRKNVTRAVPNGQ